MQEELVKLNEETRRLMKAVRLMDAPGKIIEELSQKIASLVEDAEKHSYKGTTAQGSLKNDQNPINTNTNTGALLCCLTDDDRSLSKKKKIYNFFII